MPKELPSPELLRKLLRYEPDTGKLYWRKRTPDMFKSGKFSSECICASWNKRYANRLALASKNNWGYLIGRISDRLYKSHRVIWAIFYGDWPDEHIDHINGIRDDNRIVNLRSVSNAENGMNTKLPATNTSGACGVFWHKKNEKWIAQINVNGRRKHIGSFADKNDAIVARKNAEIKYGYHENHGR